MFQWLRRKKPTKRFPTVVDPGVLHEILRSPKDIDNLPRPRRVEATILQANVQGYVPLCDQRPPEVAYEFLNEYLTRMNRVIFSHGGTIEKYEGDRILLLFGIPSSYPDHERRAVYCAIEMEEEFTRYRNEFVRAKGWPDVYLRIGISSGEVIAGLIGGGGRYDYTALGEPVNLAARLEALNKEYGSWIMCTDSTYERTKDSVVAKLVPGVELRAARQATRIYIIRGLTETGPRDHIWGEGHGGSRNPQMP